MEVCGKGHERVNSFVPEELHGHTSLSGLSYLLSSLSHGKSVEGLIFLGDQAVGLPACWAVFSALWWGQETLGVLPPPFSVPVLFPAFPVEVEQSGV